jgi:predicted nucleic acid-binding protein
MQSVLLDTGPLVAVLDRADAFHSACVDVLEHLEGPLITTEAVLTETLHLLGTMRAQDLALEFILRGAATLVPTDRRALLAVRALMRKYADTPMDYADATLVHLGQEIDADTVFTLDRRGFQTYRLSGRRAFRILP